MEMNNKQAIIWKETEMTCVPAKDKVAPVLFLN
jgi:hypothetical protein